MPNMTTQKPTKPTKEPIIIAAQPDEEGFRITYRLGRKEWDAYKPFTVELYKQLIPFLGYA